jgi:hypothetical protein
MKQKVKFLSIDLIRKFGCGIVELNSQQVLKYGNKVKIIETVHNDGIDFPDENKMVWNAPEIKKDKPLDVSMGCYPDYSDKLFPQIKG